MNVVRFTIPASSDVEEKKFKFLVNRHSYSMIFRHIERKYHFQVHLTMSSENALTVTCTLDLFWITTKRFIESEVKRLLYEFLDPLFVYKHSTSQEAFPLVLTELKSQAIKNLNEVAISEKEDSHEIYVTGEKCASNEASKILSDIIKKVEEDLNSEKREVQVKEMKRHQVLMLQFCKFEQDIIKKHKRISLTYDLTKNTVEFEGPRGELTLAISEMDELISKVVETEIGCCSAHFQNFLQNSSVHEYISRKMKEVNIIGVWECNKSNETITVFSLSNQDATQIACLLKECVIETFVKTQVKSHFLLSTQKWQNEIEKIEKESGGFVQLITQPEQKSVIILATDHRVEKAKKEIEEFMKMNALQASTLELERHMLEYLSMNCSDTFRCIETELVSEFVDVKIEKCGIIIKGTENGISRAMFGIELIMKSIPISLLHDGECSHCLQDNKGLVSDSVTSKSSIEDNEAFHSSEESSGTYLKTSQFIPECAICESYSQFYCNNCHQRMCENCKDDHIRDPDNINHEIALYSQRKKMFWKRNCKLHPTKLIDLCCNDCHEVVCSLCTTTENHRGHHFLDLERVFTEQTTMRLKDIGRIRDDILPKSQDLLEDTRSAIVDVKRELKNIRESMQEQANKLKNLVDKVLSEYLQVLGDFEVSAIDGLSTQEEELDVYVSSMQRILEELQISVSSFSPCDIVKDMKKNREISIKPIPDGAKYSLPVFTKGLLCKEEISKEFGFLQIDTQRSSPSI